MHLILDTGHLYWAGGDPLDMARVYTGRIRHVHLKDIRRDVMERCNAANCFFLKPVMDSVLIVPGDGVIDLSPIFRVLVDAAYEGWLMVEAEQDTAGANPLKYARKARAFLRDVAEV